MVFDGGAAAAVASVGDNDVAPLGEATGAVALPNEVNTTRTGVNGCRAALVKPMSRPVCIRCCFV